MPNSGRCVVLYICADLYVVNGSVVLQFDLGARMSRRASLPKWVLGNCQVQVSCMMRISVIPVQLPEQLREFQQICRAERRPSRRHCHERIPGTTSVHPAGRHASSPAPAKPCGPAAARCTSTPLVSTAPRDASVPHGPLPGTGPQTRTSPCAGTHTQDAEPATGAIETFRDARKPSFRRFRQAVRRWTRKHANRRLHPLYNRIDSAHTDGTPRLCPASTVP
jgi:hypothetical protein